MQKTNAVERNALSRNKIANRKGKQNEKGMKFNKHPDARNMKQPHSCKIKHSAKNAIQKLNMQNPAT